MYELFNWFITFNTIRILHSYTTTNTTITIYVLECMTRYCSLKFYFILDSKNLLIDVHFILTDKYTYKRTRNFNGNSFIF